jgi:hypothetical protein
MKDDIALLLYMLEKREMRGREELALSAPGRSPLNYSPPPRANQVKSMPMITLTTDQRQTAVNS